MSVLYAVIGYMLVRPSLWIVRRIVNHYEYYLDIVSEPLRFAYYRARGDIITGTLGPIIYTGSNTSFCHNVIVSEVHSKGGHRIT